ncbi:MAG: hypothetical protein M3395_00270 [Chloroflexota bacterium]|nr:hypothetical protein [Chloroflexota bacterium]
MRLLIRLPIALAGVYLVAWGSIYLTADRSMYWFGVDESGDLSGGYPRIPWQSVFPDPGMESTLPPLALALGAVVVVAVAAGYMIGRPRRSN